LVSLKERDMPAYAHHIAGVVARDIRPAVGDPQPETLTMNDERERARQERLRTALRENLKRRKSQARGRTDQAVVTPEDDKALRDRENVDKPMADEAD
jgi:hypothetical protein